MSSLGRSAALAGCGLTDDVRRSSLASGDVFFDSVWDGRSLS